MGSSSGPHPSRRALTRPPQGQAPVPHPEERPMAASRRMRPLTGAIVVAILALSGATAAHADADHAAIAKASLEQYIRPGYTQFAQERGRTEAICRRAVRQAVTRGAEGYARCLRRHGRGLERGRADPLRPGGARASLRAHLLLAGPQGPRHPSDPRGARQAGQERHRADGPRRQERGATGPARARISPLWRRRGDA